MHISWARLASFCHLGVISDPLIVSNFHNETHDPKGQENNIYTIMKDRETFYRRHTVSVTSCSKACVKRPLSKRPHICFKTSCRLIQVKNIAECSILEYFRPSLICHKDLCFVNSWVLFHTSFNVSNEPSISQQDNCQSRKETKKTTQL